MEKSLDQLIKHLLAEIALCGPSGANITELTSFIDDFYYGARDTNPSTPSSTQVIDDGFIAAVWAWLGRQQDVSIGPNKRHNKTPLLALADPSKDLCSQSSNLPRVCVSDERIYEAICGHTRDDKRVFKSEYGLLLVIASARSEGILQGECGRLAGQDKRSVPKRTDSLHAKGYIIKDDALLRGAATSRLTLRRFASNAQLAQAATITGDLGPFNRKEQSVQDVVNAIVHAMGEKSILEVDSLADTLKLATELGNKVLLKLLRLLSKDGYIKKTKAAIGASAHTGEPKLCYRRLRDFIDTDLKAFDGSGFELARPLREVLEEAEEAAGTTTGDGAAQQEALAQWNPDRNIPNVIQQATELARLSGISMSGIRGMLGGHTLKRTLDSGLARLSFASLLTQPKHARHLAVVRTNKGAATGPHYVHYSYAAFLDRLEQDKIDTSSVPGAKKVSPNPAEDAAGLDSFGFPVLSQQLLLSSGTPTLTDCVGSANAEDILGRAIESSDSEEAPPKPLKTRVQSLIDSPAEESTRTTTLSPRTGRPLRKYKLKNPGKKQAGEGDENAVRGRPRKFLAGTEKFWQNQFWQAKVEAEGRGVSRTGLMNHPAGLALFRNRPDRFDETVAEARKAHLPLPRANEDISDTWVAQTVHVLERSQPGAYVSPAGVHLSRISRLSRILIVRSDRLTTLDFRERPKIYGYRFLTSMVAHSTQAWRWYPTKPTPKKHSKQAASRKLDVEYPTELLDAFGRIPRLGVFYEASPRLRATTSPAPEMHLPKATAEEMRQLMAETDVDSEVERVERREKEKRKEESALHVSGRDPTSPVQPLTPSRSVQDMAPDEGNPLRNQIDGTDGTPPPQRSSRRRKLTQRAIEWLDGGGTGVSVGSPSAASDNGSLAGDENTSTPTHDNRKSDVRPRRRSRTGVDNDLEMTDALQTQSASTINQQGRTSGVSRIPPADTATGGTPRLPPTASPAEGLMPFSDTTTNQSPRLQPREAATHMSNTPQSQSSLPFNEQAPATFSSRPSLPLASDAKPQLASRISSASGLVPAQDAAADQHSSRSQPSSLPELALHAQERSRILSKPVRGATGFCRKALLRLLSDSNGVAPKDLGLLRQALTNYWQQEGQSSLPTPAIVKTSVQGLINAGLVKSHTFTFRARMGILHSRSILFFPEFVVTDEIVQGLKRAISDAEAARYIPPLWQQASTSAAQVESPEPEPELEPTLAPGEAPPDRLPRPPTPVPAQTSSHDGSAISEATSPPRSSSTRARRSARRTPQRDRGRSPSSSVSRGSKPRALSASSNTGFLTLRTSRSPSVSNASVASSTEGVSHVGFLTLKVPRLGSLPQVRAFNANLHIPEHLKLSPVPLATPVAEASPPPKRQRKPRASRAKRESTLQQIIWKKPRVPRSLDDLILEQYEHEGIASSTPSQDAAQSFFDQVATVQSWEKRLEDKLLETKAPWTFINHLGNTSIDMLAEPRNWYSVSYGVNDRAVEIEILDFESWLPFAQALEKSKLEPGLGSKLSTPSSNRRITRQDTGSIRKKRRLNFDDIRIDDDRPYKRRTRQKPATDLVGEYGGNSDDGAEDTTGEFRVRRTYKPKKANPTNSLHDSILAKITNEEIFHITVSVLLARTLAGGKEMKIDWNIVGKMNPTLLRSTIVSRWKAINSIYSEQVASLTQRIRVMYLKAAEAMEVPLITNLGPKDSAWDVIMSWALGVLPNFLDETTLPSSRAGLRSKYTLSYTELENIRALLVPSTTMRVSEREEVVVTVPFSTPLSMRAPSQPLVDIARSLILSTLLMPTFSADHARAATKHLAGLSPDRNIAEVTTADALRDLLSAQIISKTTSALKRLPALLEGGQRAYMMTEKLDDMLETKRIINRTLLREAMDYKLDILDEAFANGDAMSIPNGGQISNGQMLAIVNLMDTRAVRVHPGSGNMKSRYGVAWERVGYQSKQLDGLDVGFAVDIQATETYVFGEGSGVVVGEVPKTADGGSWPMWVDVTGELLVDIWEKVLAAVLGIVSIRPGVGVQEVKTMLGGVLTSAEIKGLLMWAQRQDYVIETASGQGWETREGWWFCLGRDTDWS